MNKKIMFVISDLEIGGAERILIFLANFLIKKKFKVRILYFKKKNNRCFNLNPKINSECLNLEKETNNIFQKIQYTYIRIKRIRKKINVYRPDYIISFLTTVNILSIIASFNLNKKLIINERNDLNKKKIPYIWKILRFLLYRFSNKVLFKFESSVCWSTFSCSEAAWLSADKLANRICCSLLRFAFFISCENAAFFAIKSEAT